MAAIRAAQLGLRTAVTEGRFWGGVCLNIGCIPAKALLRNAEVAQMFPRDAEKFGVKISGDVSLDYRAAYERSRVVAEGRSKGVTYLMRKNKITQFEGRGTFLDPHTMQVRMNDSEATLSFRSCIIATGATVKLLPGTTLGMRVVTYEEQILADSLPASLIIAGAGAIGVEFAYLLRSYGVEVTLIEFLDRIAPLEDEEVSAEPRRFKRQGRRQRLPDPLPAREEIAKLRAERDQLRQAARLHLGHQLDQANSRDLVTHVQELTQATAHLEGRLHQATEEKALLEGRVSELEDDLAAARTSLRRMIRAENASPGTE